MQKTSCKPNKTVRNTFRDSASGMTYQEIGVGLVKRERCTMSDTDLAIFR
ncbi:unnamed protein product, partial [Rotaria magnacalcarata]